MVPVEWLEGLDNIVAHIEKAYSTNRIIEIRECVNHLIGFTRSVKSLLPALKREKSDERTLTIDEAIAQIKARKHANRN